MMIVFAILAVMSILGTLSFTVEGIVSGIVYGVIYGYFFVVLYSLYDQFRKEYERGYNPQHMQPMYKA
jgi:TM2 domain-containing membrane protein YozV